MIGDIYGRPGRDILLSQLPSLIGQYDIDFVVANGENLAGGAGITKELIKDLRVAGVDVITTGNHVWDRREFLKQIVEEDRVLRPANYPVSTPGMGYFVVRSSKGHLVGVLNLMGRVFSHLSLESPFTWADQAIAEMGNVDAIVVDMHAEATSEKMAMGFYLDGKVSAVVGTHTHVPTADAFVLPKGTAYQTDLGMTGPYLSVIGAKAEQAIERFITQLPIRFEPATGPAQLCGAVIRTQAKGILATAIESIVIREEF